MVDKRRNENLQIQKNTINPELLPLVIKAKTSNLNLSEWISENKKDFEIELSKYGAILFRGFDVDNVEKFNDFISSFDTKPLPYMFRSSPRNEIKKEVKDIYTSTIYPNDRSIRLHNESSYSRIWGKKIVFCCLTPAEEGGETPIANSRNIFQSIPEALRLKFKEKQVKYVRNFFPEFGMPWEEVFQTEDRNKVLEICKNYAIDIEFIDDRRVTISWVKPAIYKHPITNEETWFNHVYFFNKYSLYEDLGLSGDDYLPEEMLTSDTFFGDGTEISFEEYTILKDAYDSNQIYFPYEKGDVLFLDNMLTAHGRMPFKGDRVIATAIIEPYSDEEIKLN